MKTRERKENEPLGPWALRRSLSWPPLWFGCVFGVAAAMLPLSMGAPVIFALFFGMIATIATTVIGSVFYAALVGAQKAEKAIRGRQLNQPGIKLRQELSSAGLHEEAGLLVEIEGLFKQIEEECRWTDPLPEAAARTATLATQIREAVHLRSRELLALSMSSESVTENEKALSNARAEIRKAAEGLRRAKTILPLQLRPPALEGEEESLADLTDQLREETDFTQRLQERLVRDGLAGDSLGSSTLGSNDDQSGGSRSQSRSRSRDF